MLHILKRGTRQGRGTAGEIAGRLFASGHNCAQAVLEATMGDHDPRLHEMAGAFGGGVGGSKCLCGAVSGGVMALGLKGKGKKSAQLMGAFRAANRVTCCVALSSPYEWKSREHIANCRRITEETAGMVEKLIQE